MALGAKFLRAEVRLIAACGIIGALFAASLAAKEKPKKVPPENHLSELAFEKDRAIAALEETLSGHAQAHERLRAAEREQEEAVQEVERHSATIRYLNEALRKAQSERSDLDRSLTDLREADRRTKESQSKLMDLAATSKDELETLRRQNEGLARDKSGLEQDRLSQQKESEKAHQELEDLKGELTRTRAVVRSFQEGPAGGGGSSDARDAAFRLRISELEAAVAKARQEIESAGSGDATGATGSPGDRVAPKPASLWSAFVTIFKDRFEKGRQGQFTGDAFDYAVVGAASVVLLGALVIVGLWLRVRSLKGRVRGLRSAPRAVERTVAAPAPEVAEPSRAPSRRSTYVPRDEREFSAVISTQKPAAAASGAASQNPTAAKSGGSSSRRVIGPVLTSQPRPAPKPAARLAETEVDLDPTPTGLRPVPETVPVPVPAHGAEDVEDELASTQIISGYGLGDGPTPKPKRDPAARPISTDKDLLNELKAVINKKFDQMR